MLLTVDLGNSRCKLRLWEARTDRPPRRIAGVDLDTAPGVGIEVSAWLAENDRAQAAALCSVSGSSLEAEVEAALRASVARAPELRLDPGLAVDCEEPERVGKDRLFAARAALGVASGSAVVVDAGTALTVDAVRADGTFLGGAIAPGPDLLARALGAWTAKLPRVEPREGPAALGRDTESALLSGIGVGFRGAARELALRVGSEAGLEGAPVVLTGGARGFLLHPPAFGDTRTIEEPDLVHKGLLAALQEALSEGRGAAWTSKSGS